MKGRDDVVRLIVRLNHRAEPVVLDLETTGLDRFKDTIISAQLCVAGEETAYYIEGELVDELANFAAPLVLHNFKFDFAFLRQRGIDLRYPKVEVPLHGPREPRNIRDTLLMHHLLDENAEHSLDSIIKEKWNDPYKEMFWGRNKSFQEAPEQERVEYACKDVIYTGLLYADLLSALREQGIPSSLIEHVHRLALALYDTEVLGVRVDLDYLTKVGEELTGRITAARGEMRTLAPEVELVENQLWLDELEKRKTPKGKAGVKRPAFNWDSGKQLQALIYGELGVRPIERKSKSTGEKRPTLDDAALEELQDAHPVIARLRDYRADQKVFGSFIEGTLERQVGGRIYPSFNVCGTVTGRISSSNPNLQQLPRDGGVRGIYVPDPGHLLISCDYGQLEVVVAAHYSKDPNLLKIIYEGASKHDITAAALGIPRQLAKTVNFACQYQCSHYKVAAILGVSEKEGLYAWQKYWETYKGEKAVIDECKATVDRGEPIINLFGRRRRFPSVFGAKWEREAAHRQAYSSLIQGTGADITHTAFYNVSYHIQKVALGRALFEVHDEILIEAKEERVEEAKRLLEDTMVEAGKVLSVPLTVDCSAPLARWEK
jgi:DNA polymerase-1